MARRDQRHFVCQACGAVHPRWAGRCEACGGWNTITEEAAPAAVPGAAGGTLADGRRRGKRLELVELDLATAPPPRLRTGIEELDRVLGGGIVAGAAMLVGGDPGIGKSTLTLQAAASLSRAGHRVVYVSGEESLDQIRLRARRLGVASAPVHLASATSVGEIVASLDGPDAPRVLVIDSVQTMYVDSLEAAPGTVSQLRAATDVLIRFAKRRGTSLLLIGHVTKEGAIAGPRVLEHMVDAVLYFEGERGHQFRLLRAVKNRFGPANEIGVFEMREEGLAEVPNPSALFLAERDEAGVAGAAVFAGMEGTRPVLVEVQALTAPTQFGTPRRAVVGWDANRLAMLLAVLETRCGLVTATRDVYLNVAGGLRVQEPAADLAVAAAIVSSELKLPAPPGTVFAGEVGLAGEVRAVGQLEARLKEAAKLGFVRAVVPRGGKERSVAGLGTRELGRLIDLFGVFDVGPPRRGQQQQPQRAPAFGEP
jgi:DNA repair protein RadA/Sms